MQLFCGALFFFSYISYVRSTSFNFVVHCLFHRQMYIFKIVPFLNPDGVYNGYYRSDTMGHNLNRVYLGPSKDIHPSIYAVRKLIM